LTRFFNKKITCRCRQERSSNATPADPVKKKLRPSEQCCLLYRRRGGRPDHQSRSPRRGRLLSAFCSFDSIRLRRARISGGEYQGRVRQLPRARGRALWLAPRSHACRASSPSRSTSPPSCSRGRPHRRRRLVVIVDRPSTPRTVTRPSLPLDRRQTIDRHHAACEIANSYSSWVSRDDHRSLKPPAQPGSPWL
jgi:hypothetical protein